MSWGRRLALSGALVLAAAWNLFFAFLKFSEGKAWLRALYLVVALPLVLLAGWASVELWKRFRANPPENNSR